jgi:type II secretory pathway predicted ATPase ExeA
MKPAARHLPMMYYRHFGLSGAPFQFTPSPKVLYPSPAHSNGLAALEGSLTAESTAVTLLIGAAGSGKTTLAMAMLAREWERSRVVYLANPKAGCVAIMREILRQLGVEEHGGEREMTEGFNRYLGSLNPGQRILVMIDEAHHLSEEVCDQIEEFLNSGRNGLQLLSLALIGEPELLERVASTRHQQLQELTVSLVVLKPLPLDEAMRYAEYRLAAFNGNAAKVFAPGALEYLLQHADGLPRRINILCHNAMLTAHAANAVQVNLEIARATVQEFERRTSEATTATSSSGGNSTKPSVADGSRVRSSEEQPARKTSWAPHGMGIGLLILSVVVMSALWLAAMRSEEQLGSNQGDAEVPAIFGDEINGGSDGKPQGIYRIGEAPGFGASLRAANPVISGKARDDIRNGIASVGSEHRQVTIGQSGVDGNSSGAHGPGFGS